MKFLIKIAYRNIFRNKRRSGLCIIAISMAVFFVIVVMGFMQGMVESMIHDVQTFETGHILINSKKYEGKKLLLPVQYPVEIQSETLEETISKIEKTSGVKKVFPRITSYVSIKDNTVKNAILCGINIEEELKYTIFNQKNKNKNKCLLAGRYPIDNKNECAIGHELAKKANLKIDDKIIMKIVSSQYSDKFYAPKIVGIFDFDFTDIDKNYILIPVSKMQKLLNLNGLTQKIYIYLNDQNNSSKIAKIIRSQYKNNDIVVNEWFKNAMMAYLDQMKIMMWVIYAVFILVSSFLIINTIIMVIHERIKEIGMMGALGMNKPEIIMVFFLESVFLSFYGAVLGTLLGGLLTFIGSYYPIDMKFFTGNSYASSNTIFIKFSFIIVLGGFLYGLVISSLCTIFPSLKAAFVEPVEALRR